MFYETRENRHGLRHDPFKALIAPRPIGWISTISRSGVCNLAPYSFFNAMSDKPHHVAFGSGGMKDTVRNIQETGEFVCSLATWDLREAMNMTSAEVAHGIDEFPLAGLTTERCRLVAPPRVKESPVALECRHWRTIPLPGENEGDVSDDYLVIGRVVAIHIDDRVIKDGRVDTAAMRPIARLGYMDYTVVTPESVFTIHRPKVDADGKVVLPKAAE